MNDKFEGLAQQLLSAHVYLEEAIELLERSMIQRALENAGGNRSEASKQLGIHRNTLLKKSIAYGLGNGRAPIHRKRIASQGRPRKPKAGAA